MAKESLFNSAIERAERSAMLADALLRMLLDESLRERMVQTVLEHARRFSWRSVRGELFFAYEMPLGGTTLAVTREGR